MEDVLTLYAQPYDNSKPVLCMDEKGKALPFSSKVKSTKCKVA